MTIRLPTGATLVAWSDPSKAAPSDCSLAFSLLPQVACYLAGTECLQRVLRLVPPMVDVVKSLNHSPELTKFIAAAQELVPCEQAASGPGALPFVQDLLCLVITALNCLIAQLKTLVAVLAGLAVQTPGNPELAEALKAAQKQAQNKADQLFSSIDSIRALLDLAKPLFLAAGIEPIQLPAPPSQTDLNSITQLLASLQDSGTSLLVAADALGGC